MADHLDRACAGLWLTGSLASQNGACSTFGIYRVAFALLIPQLPIGPFDFTNGMSALAQKPGQASAVGPSALDADCSDRPHRLCPGLKRAVTLAAGGDSGGGEVGADRR